MHYKIANLSTTELMTVNNKTWQIRDSKTSSNLLQDNQART